MMFSFSLFGVPSISASKHNNGSFGLIRIRGSTEALSRFQALTFTVTDETEKTVWTRTLTRTPSSEDPLDVSVSGTSVANRISVVAYFLKENPEVEADGVTHLLVQNETSCVALDDVGAGVLPRLDLFTTSETSSLYSNPLEVEIVQSSTFSKAKLVIRRPPGLVTHWKISIERTDKAKHVFFLTRSLIRYGEQEFQFPIDFRCGRKYSVLVQGVLVSEQSSLINNQYKILFSGSTEFKADLTTSDIASLHAKAVQHVRYHGDSICKYFYRNKPQYYFDDIFTNHNGLMEVYIKDNSGDPGSPINGRINGLFFMASVEPGTTWGQPVARSAFGGTRLLLSTADLLNVTPNVYFADFYCMRGQYHYVTLVLTKPYSETDAFCANRLLRLSLDDKDNNPFLFRDESGQLRVSTRDHLHVELLFTENLDISQYQSTLQRNTPLIGKGQTTPGGLPKKANCSTCNIITSPTHLGLFGSYFSFDSPMNPF